MDRIAKIAVLAAFATLVACATATIGQPFPAGNVALLRTGMSTTADARSLLGEPGQVQTNEAGEQLYIWQYISSHATSGFASTNVQTTQQQAALVFGADGRLLRAQQLINVPSPSTASIPKWEAVPTRPTEQRSDVVVKSKEQQLQELQNTQGLSYEEYQRRYRLIMGSERRQE